jgi:hypothetical protein
MIATLLNPTNLIGLAFLIVFLVAIIIFAFLSRKGPSPVFRRISAFEKLGHSIGLAVEAGTRLHLSLGRGNLNGEQAAPALIGLSVLERVARTASISDRPPIATSGDGALGILSQDTLYNAFRSVGAGGQYDSGFGQITGLTPFSYAAGTLPLIYDEHVSTTILSGHFGSEIALITDASERAGGSTLAGSDDLPAQAVIYAAAQEPLIGEELFAAGAYLKSNPLHAASLRAQDVLRWTLILAILAGAVLKFLQIL